MSDAAVLRRTSSTFGLYLTFGCLGYMLTALGAILPELREERGLPRAEVALYPSAFALGLVVVGLIGHRLARRLGPLALPSALVALVGGAAIIAVAGGRLGTGIGALVLGLGGAGLVQLIPAGLRALHGGDGAVPIGEANAVASTASVLSPVLIGAALAQGLGWRFAFAVPPLALAAVLLLTRRAVAPVISEDAAPAPGERTPRTFVSRWFDLVLAVGVEFCMVFWAADFLRSVKDLGSGSATTFSAAFLLGMAVGRTVSGPVVRAAGGADRLLAAATGVGVAGFAILWAAPAPLAVAGLLVVGLGVALLYPVILAQALAAWPSQPVRAAARCALASGVAIGVAPLALGTLADLTTLRAAVFVAPALLLILLVRCGWRLRTGGQLTLPRT
ncbi:MFS transporter [Actinomadura sp. 7K507]|uniref:MFS transporter n=1 Tax=Actinomadura sp. 7K507 TaxID=2530365 RepID=UPI0010531AF0|nr:MFS transporter [Actinomadura sp. 7K507]TDC74651.1 MFS transporter [Actinomadura sp. 7K507]